MTCHRQREQACSTCVNRYVHDYFVVNVGTVIKPSSVDTYRSAYRGYDAYLAEHDSNVLDARKEDVVRYIEMCVRRGNREATLSVKLGAIHNLYRHIRLRMDVDDGLVLDPIELELIDLQRYNTPDPVDREALSREELRRLFDSMESYRNRLFVITAAETGLRNSDLRNILVSDVDFDALAIHVPDPKNSKPYDVPISDQLAFEFRQWLVHHRGAYAAAAKSPYLFPSQTGPKLATNSSLNELIKDAASRAGIQDVIGTSEITPAQRDALKTDKDSRDLHRVTTHTLRHTFLTMLKDADVPLSYRQLVANHSNPATTMQYEHGTNDAFETIRDRFDPPR